MAEQFFFLSFSFFSFYLSKRTPTEEENRHQKKIWWQMKIVIQEREMDGWMEAVDKEGSPGEGGDLPANIYPHRPKSQSVELHASQVKRLASSFISPAARACVHGVKPRIFDSISCELLSG